MIGRSRSQQKVKFWNLYLWRVAYYGAGRCGVPLFCFWRGDEGKAPCDHMPYSCRRASSPPSLLSPPPSARGCSNIHSPLTATTGSRAASHALRLACGAAVRAVAKHAPDVSSLPLHRRPLLLRHKLPPHLQPKHRSFRSAVTASVAMGSEVSQGGLQATPKLWDAQTPTSKGRETGKQLRK
jgi:hypothetical protein